MLNATQTTQDVNLALSIWCLITRIVRLNVLHMLMLIPIEFVKIVLLIAKLVFQIITHARVVSLQKFSIKTNVELIVLWE